MLKRNTLLKWIAAISTVLLLLLIGYVAWRVLIMPQAADGGGTITVSPTIVPTGGTGQQLSFAFTSDSVKDSGSMRVLVPTLQGWSAPNGVPSTAGYTTATTSGTIGTVKDTLESTAGWTDNNDHMVLSIDTADYQTFSGSLLNTINSYATAGEKWFFDEGGAQDWGAANAGANLRVAQWFKPSTAVGLGDFTWQVDDTAGLASPLDSVSLPLLTSGVWSYKSIDLGVATRPSVLSYGYEYTTDIGAINYKTDSPSVLFDAAEVTTNWDGGTVNVGVTALGIGQQEGSFFIRCTYAALAGTNERCRRSTAPLGAFTIGPNNTVSFWARSSVDTTGADLEFIDASGADLTSPDDTVLLPALTMNVWTFITLNAPNSANNTVQSYGINQVNDLGAFTLDLDAFGKQINGMNTTTGWTAPSTATNIILFADSVTKKEGTNSLLATVDVAAVAGDRWYKTLGASEDWSTYTKAGFWLRSTLATSAGDLQFAYDDATDLSSPIATLSIPALSASTWTWIVLSPLTGVRSTVNSYGIVYNTDLVFAANINFDYFLLGPGVPSFHLSIGGVEIGVAFLELASSGTVSILYGSGGGANGANIPGTAGTSTFSSYNRDMSDGTLTLMGASPQVTRNSSPVMGSFTDSPDPVVEGYNITFSSGTWTDDNVSEQVMMFVCKTNALMSNAVGGCSGGQWGGTGIYATTNPQNIVYGALFANVATSPNSYYIFLCDIKQISNSCSAGSTGTFTVQNQSFSFSTSASALHFGTLNSGASRYANTTTGSGSEVTAHTLTALTNAASGYIITVKGATLTRSSFTINAIGATNTAPSVGTEQFGMRGVVVPFGTGTVTAPYAAAGFAYAATVSTPSQIASGAGDSVSTTFSWRYLANISTLTENGLYASTLTFTGTPQF